MSGTQADGAQSGGSRAPGPKTGGNRQQVQMRDIAPLLPDEEVLVDARPAWSAYAGQLLLAGIVILGGLGASGGESGGAVTMFALLIGGIIVASVWYQRRKVRYIVTDRRVLVRTGISSKGTNEAWMEDVRGMQTGASFLERLDGHQVPVEISAKPIEIDGQTLVVGIFRDITDRRYREEALAKLLGAVQDMIQAERHEAVTDTAVAAAADILGFPLIGVHLLNEDTGALEPAAISESMRRYLDGPAPTFAPGEGLVWEAFDAGETRVYDDVRTHEARYNHGTAIRSEIHVPLGTDGVMVIASTIASAFGDHDTRLAELLAASTHLSLQRVDRQRRLEANQQELVEQNNRLLEFASVLSHDLRNPLNVATLQLDLAKTADPGDADDHLATVEQAHDRMERIIDDLLWLAREGREIGATEPVDLASVVDAAWTTVATPEATLDVTAEGTVTADRDRLHQLFENLFHNAVEHGGTDVTVEVGTLADGFFVADSGQGLPETDAGDAIAPGVTTDDESGFGLSIVERIVDAHGWDLTVANEDDGGARFEFHVPAED